MNHDILPPTMIITSQIQTKKGTFEVEYQDADSLDHLPLNRCRQAYAICYWHNQIVLCVNSGGQYNLPGGTIESGESLRQALAREVAGETNMKVLEAHPIGYQKCWNDHQTAFFQVRYYAKVAPIGPFESDPAGHVTTIELVNPQTAAQFLNWGQIGTRLFERAAQKHQCSQVR